MAETQIPSPSVTAEMLESSPEATVQLPHSSKGEFGHLNLLEMAVRDLSFRLGVELNSIVVISIQSVDWPDSGLGCPFPGVNYAQVITPGFMILLATEGQVYFYHTNTEKALWHCLDGNPQLPLIPIVPGEIDDGVPWMPVDPIPTLTDEIIIADPDPVK